MTATEPGPINPAARVPALSVVVPNYNHGRYLEAALQAHLDQTVPPLEIIVVDDASTDDSCAVVERVSAKHPSVKLIRLAANGGVNAAINRGLREASGDYVCFSAADDLVARDFAARSLEVLAPHPTAGLCFSDPALLLGDSGVVRRFALFLSDRPCMLSSSDIKRVLKRNYFSFPSNTILYRRDTLAALGGFVEELRWYADWFASYVLAFRHGACYVPEVLAFFRVSADSYAARGVRQRGVQRDLLYCMLDLLESGALTDVAPSFRGSAILPELRARVLMWLLASPRHRRYLTPWLAVRLLFGSLWYLLMPYTPARLRRAARWLLGAVTRRAMARRGPLSSVAAVRERR